MRHLLLLLSTSTFLLTAIQPIAHAADRAALMPGFNAIVMIRGYNPDGGMAYGSGVVVAKDKVMTNCHIFRQSKQPWVSRGEDSYPIVSYQADRYHDLCLLTTDGLPLTPVLIGNSVQLKKGQELISIGHSGGVPAPLTSAGTLKSLYPYQNNGNVIRTNARFSMGASGSGLFDETGKLIGINTFKTPGRRAFFYALPVEWLDDLEKQPVETVFPVAGKAFWEEDDNKKPFFMQMALPELNQQWAQLAKVAKAWIQAEPKNSEAWYELGHAEENLGNIIEAEKAYIQSIEMDSGNTDALFRLGLLANNRGDQGKVKEIRLALLQLDADMAEAFNTALACSVNC